MTISVDPVIGHWGGFALRWYGIIILASIGVALVISRREAARRGLPGGLIDDLALPVVVAGIVGARLFHGLDNWDRYAEHPGRLLTIQAGGLAIYGALIGGGLVVALFAWVRRVNLWRLMDVITPGLLLAQATGRVACIVNGDAYGAPTSLPWAFTYTNPAAFIPERLLGVPTHPYPVYEMLWDLAVFAVIWRLRDRLIRPGSLFLAYAALYSVGRLLLTEVRQEPTLFFGFQEAQIIALVVLAAVAFVTARRVSGRATPAMAG